MTVTSVLEFQLADGQEYTNFTIDSPLLQPFEDLEGWAWYRVAPTWIESKPIQSLHDLESEYRSHLILLRRKSDHNRIICLYPLSSESAISNITRESNTGQLLLRGRRISERTAGRIGCVVASADSDREVHTLVGDCVKVARKWLSGVEDISPFIEPLPGALDGVGFCTWSSIGEDIRLNTNNLGELLENLVAAQIPIQTFIIDDGWLDYRVYAQGLTDITCKTGPRELANTWRLRGLWGFDAWSGMGDRGLEAVVANVKNKLEVIPGTGQVSVGVWLALTGGYWDGVHPDSPLVTKYNCRPYKISRDRIPAIPNAAHSMAFIPPGIEHYYLPPPEDSYRFYLDWFSFLSSVGVSFVKVDNQASLVVLDGVDGAECQFALFRNMTRAASKVFGPGQVIHCMAHHEGMWGGTQGLGLETGGDKFVWRNSDDFGLVGKKANPHQQHVHTNLYNAILTSQLSMVPDADMFMTADQYPLANALLRALFPGPLLLSDHPGKSDINLVNRLIAKDKDGIFRVIHSKTTARTLARRVFDLDINNSGVGKATLASVCIGEVTIVGAWNTRDDEDRALVSDSLSISDVEDALGLPKALPGPSVVCHMDLLHGSVCAATVITENHTDDVGSIELATGDATSFWIAPFHSVGTIKMAVLGLIDHFAGAVAISDLKVAATVSFNINYQGKVGLILSDNIKSVSANVNGDPVKVTTRTLPALDNASTSLVHLAEFDVKSSGPESNIWQVEVKVE